MLYKFGSQVPAIIFFVCVVVALCNRRRRGAGGGSGGPDNPAMDGGEKRASARPACTSCQLIQMGEMACYLGYCPDCGTVPNR